MFKNKKQQQEITSLKRQLTQQQEITRALQQELNSLQQDYQRLADKNEQLNGVGLALDKSMAVIEFDTTGVILKANKNFLDTVGYTVTEVQGKHHRIFCDDDFYQQNPHFWQSLAAGQFNAGKYKRFTKQGKAIWLEATYNPIVNTQGQVTSIVKFASDITSRVHEAEAVKAAAQMAAKSSQETSKIVDAGSKQLTNAVAVTGRIAEVIENSAAAANSLTAQAKSINDIVAVIQGIADQTNLLALNAAIEAARAGEQGRGFAVVADEVRTLASRTSLSTDDISEEVKNTQGVATTIAKLVEDLNEMIGATAESVQAADHIMRDVKSGSDDVVRQITRLL